jgi:DNA modification methylase
MDIRQGDTLQRESAREEKDERHICPLQLPVIERCIELWSNKGDIVLTPFLGIGSEVYQAILQGRKGVGIELKESYYNQAVLNCQRAVEITHEGQLFE